MAPGETGELPRERECAARTIPHFWEQTMNKIIFTALQAM